MKVELKKIKSENGGGGENVKSENEGGVEKISNESDGDVVKITMEFKKIELKWRWS